MSAVKGKIEMVALTDVGQVRTNNEDAVGVDADIGLAILADGMGGYKAGEVASGMTIASVTETVRERLPDIDDQERLDDDGDYSAEAIMLRDALELAHTSVYQVSRTQKQCEGMGTTAVVVLFHDDSFALAYVGDSRLYRLRGGQLEAISSDHSLVQELVDRGFYTIEEAQEKVGRNIVTRALGVEADVKIDLIEEPVAVGDIYLLCSDGLTDLVADDAIGLTLNKYPDNLDQAGQALIDMANAAGGKDNISVVLARIDGQFARKRGLLSRFLKWF